MHNFLHYTKQKVYNANIIKKSMSHIFDITYKTNRKIHLSRERWAHILRYHPYLANILEEIKETLTKPFIIVSSLDDENKCHYYKPLKSRKGYLLVSVKYLNGEGLYPNCLLDIENKEKM